MPKKTATKQYADTTVHVPADERDIMAALLRTPPPPAGDKATRKPVKKRARKKNR